MADGETPRGDGGLGPASHTKSIPLSWMGQRASERHLLPAPELDDEQQRHLPPAPTMDVEEPRLATGFTDGS